jgi:hypothetical protein
LTYKPKVISKKEERLDTMGDIALLANTFTRINSDDEQRVLKTERFHIAGWLSLMHRSVPRLTNAKGDFFKAKKIKDGLWLAAPTSPAAKIFIRKMSIDFESIKNQYRHHTLSPIFNAFECVARRIPTFWYDYTKSPHPIEYIDRVLRRLNTAARALCARLRSTSNRMHYSDFRRNAQKRFHSIVRYMHACMRKRSNLTVLRLDLHMDEVTASLSKGSDRIPKKQIDEVSRLREKFTHHLKRHFGNGLIGYIGKVEAGADRGLHIHFVIFLDAAKHQQDVSITKALGETWRNIITKGRGNYFNCNAEKCLYKHLAIGKINTNSPESIIGLRFIAAYLSLGELFAKANFPKNFRSLCKGIPPEPSNAKGGRPSSHQPDFDIRTIDMKEATRQIAFI